MIIATVDEGKLELGVKGDTITIMTEFIRIGVEIADGFAKQGVPKPMIMAFFDSAHDTLMQRLEDMFDAR